MKVFKTSNETSAPDAYPLGYGYQDFPHFCAVCRTTMYKIHVEWEGMDRGWPLGGGDIEGSIHGMGGKMVGSV